MPFKMLAKISLSANENDSYYAFKNYLEMPMKMPAIITVKMPAKHHENSREIKCKNDRRFPRK
jgi:hypothetical protein